MYISKDRNGWREGWRISDGAPTTTRGHGIGTKVRLIHELFFDMYIDFYNYITFNNLIHNQHVRYILKIIETI